MNRVHEIKRLLDACTPGQCREILEYLQAAPHPYPIEQQLKVPADLILDALGRASGMMLRGIRGLITEAAFEHYVLAGLPEWSVLPLTGDPPYDFKVENAGRQVRIQVKMQRQKAGQPMLARQARKEFSADMYVVETQRTRSGKRTSAHTEVAESTRPYRFDEFDVLAVSMQPSTGDWASFVYTVARWLQPDSGNRRCLDKFQPVPKTAGGNWTGDLEVCIEWFLSRRRRVMVRESDGTYTESWESEGTDCP